MNAILVTGLILVIILLTLMQTILVLRYHRFLNGQPKALEDDAHTAEAPNVAIILCLRGFEADTPECLSRLTEQHWPNYELHIAFDSRDDSAVPQVEQFFADSNFQPVLHFFTPQATCSYKCSAIIHTLKQIDANIPYVAFCDADAMVDPEWLTDLITPLQRDTQIGAVTGNRWFSPPSASVGGWVRSLWNAAAIVQMHAYKIAWGGSMVVRRSVIDECKLTEKWAACFCEDTVLTSSLRSHGFQVYRQPCLIVQNSESCSVAKCFEWISRQLLTVRLHHADWWLVQGHGIITGLTTIVAPTAAVVYLCFGHSIHGCLLAAVWMLYQMVNLVLLRRIEHDNVAVLKQRQMRSGNLAATPRKNDAIGVRFAAMATVQLLHPLAVLKTTLMRRVSWRGIRYSISRDDEIRVLDD